jgi:hypothetical protein
MGYTVGSVSVTGVNAATCAGKTLSVTMADSHESAIGTGTAPITGAGSSATVIVELQVPARAAEVVNTHLVIT